MQRFGLLGREKGLPRKSRTFLPLALELQPLLQNARALRFVRATSRAKYCFKRLETQEELDAMLRADYEAWVQYMKDADAWQEE
jgi:tripartite-type tricarboxylate transporter receptor subunit TctC